MLHRAATNAYSWWWASHIRTKQSKWLEQHLHDVEEKVQYMMKIIDDDGDSFAKRAEMYYRKRPELISLVEEYFRAYRAIAERYDHLSRELQHANRTIASVYPEKVQFHMEDEEESVPPESGNTLPKVPPSRAKSMIPVPRVPDVPKKDFPPPVVSTTKRKQLAKTVSSVVAAKNSGLSKTEALDEIDRLQKEILVLQTEKEFVKSMYERGAAKHWEIESQITEMQIRVSDLQDEFGIGTVIEDDEARGLMANTALKSCRETLADLHGKQESVAEAARQEKQKIKETRQKLEALRHEFLPNQTQLQQDDEARALPHNAEEGPESETTIADENLELLREKIKEQLELSSETTVTAIEVAEKIDELVEKVITLEAAVLSQTALLRRLTMETTELQTRVRTLEEDKVAVIEDSAIVRPKLRVLEEEFSRIESLSRSVEDQNNNLQTHLAEASYVLDHLSEKLQSVRLVSEAEEETAVTDASPEEGLKEHEDVIPEGNSSSAVSESGKETDVGKEDENPDQRSSVKAEADDDNGVVISENREEKGQVPDLVNAPAKSPEKGQEQIEHKEEDEKQESSDEADGISDSEEDQDSEMEEGDQPNWRELFLNGLENREKALLDEYTSILRSYKEVKKKLIDGEKKNRDASLELAMQIKELKTANAFKDEEIRSLRKNVSPRATNPDRNQDTSLAQDKPSQQEEADTDISEETKSSFPDAPSSDQEHQPVTGSMPPLTETEQGESKKISTDKSLAVSTIEKNIREDIDDMQEENLEFWLRFSTYYHQVKKFQTSIQDLKAELSKLEENKKNGEGTKQQSIKLDVRPIYTHMREIQTELILWLEHNTLLKEELQGRFSSLCNLQEQISTTMHSDSNAQEAEVSCYQAAKFQGEVLNMKQENIKIKEELLKGLDRVRALQLDVEATLLKMDEDFEISKSKGPSNSKNSVNRTRVPLRSFLFGVKLKRQKQSFFSCMSPTLQKQYSDLTVGLPP